MTSLLFFPRKTTNCEGLFQEFFQDCVKCKKENRKGFLSLDDVIIGDNRSDNNVIAGYF